MLRSLRVPEPILTTQLSINPALNINSVFIPPAFIAPARTTVNLTSDLIDKSMICFMYSSSMEDNYEDVKNGTPVNYKVYLTSDVNAWAMANGCVRVYSGLMDMMTDNEVEGVLGHEMGHVALGHTREKMQTAYATMAARDAVSATSGVASQLSQSQLGDLVEGVINATFSRSEESEADDFSYDLLKKCGISTQGLASSFDKLATLSGTAKSMFDSHPPSTERAQHIRERIAADKK